MDSVDLWMEQKQGVRLEAKVLAEAERASARTGALAREKARALPFDTDPTAFWRIFERLAGKNG